MWKCPNNKEHQKFIATAHVTQEWVIDKNNNFEECISECTQVVHNPDKDDSVTCKECGNDAIWIEEK